MKTGDFLESDELYIFIQDRPESYLIPLDALGGLDLWQEILQKELFPADVAVEMASIDGELRCYPQDSVG